MAFLRPTLLQALVLCLAVWLNTALATDLVLTTGSNSLAPTPVSTGDTLTVTCPVGPCTVTAASGGIFAVENGASLVMNGFTLVQTGATDAITLAGNASLTMSGVTFGDGTSSGNAAVVKAVADSTPTITVTNSTVTGRAGAGGSVFWFQGAGNSALTIDGLIFTGNTDATLVKGTAMTDLLTASITNSYFYSSAASGTAASLFDADESNVALTVDGNYLDGINSRIIQIKETNNPANTFTLSMSGNTITKSALSTASTHLISMIKVAGTATLTNNLFQSNTVGGTSAIIYFNQNPATTSLTAENNQFISNTAPFGNIHVSSAVVTVVLRDHTVQTCACTSGAGIYFLAATGSSFLLERGTITENAHGSGTAGLIAVSTSNLASYVIRDSYFYYNRLSSISGNAMLTFSSTTMIDALIENSEFDTIQGRTAGAVLTIGSANTGTVTIRDSYFHDCSATNGALKIGSTSTVNVNIDNCTFSNNLATFDSPGVTSDNSHNGVIAIENSIFRDNTGGSGGAIDHRTSGQGKMIIRNCVFERNTATVMGGAIHVLNNQYPITLEDCAFYHNTAPKGGVWASEQGTKGYPLGIGNVTFFENSATEEGGVFYLLEVNTNYEFQNMNFIRNTAAVGGAIFMDENPYNVTIDACTFDSNSATEMAGAVYLGGTNPSITNSVFTSNEAPLGSSVLLANSGDISLQELEFTNGESNHGSLYLNGGVGLSASELTFTENVGSAIYATGTFSGPLSFAALHVTQNVDTDSVSGVGDCIVNFDTFTGDVTISNSEFADNEVSVGSIIKFSGTGGVTVTDCEFTSNTGAIFYGDEATNSAFEDCDFASNSALAAPDQELMSMFRVLDSSSLSIEGSLVSGAHYDHLLDVKSFEPVSISHSDFFIDSFEDSLFNIDSTQVTMNTVNIQVAPSETLGTCFVLDKTASLTMIDITISGCQSTKAPALLFASGKSVIDISGSTIENITETDSSAFQVTENSHLTLSDSTFKNVVGGLFFISGSGAKATISDTTVSEGETSSSEASFFHISRGAQVNMTNVSVSKGNSLSSGGCVTVDSGSLDWVGGSISQCTSATQGAAISFSGKVNAQLSGITFDGNVAFQGGAISVSQLFSSSVVIQECDFTNNEAESAGVLYIAAPTGNTFVFEDCTFDSNIASELGGVMMGLDFAAVDFVDCTITNNQAKQGGMGFLDWNSRVTITSSTAENNVASESGGLFFMDKSSELTLTESTVTGSQAQTGSGGAVYMTQTAEITVVDTDFVQCAAAIDGGAISSPFGSKCAATISDSSFTLCHADVQGGAISFSQFSSSSFVLGGNTFSNNTADLGGALSNLNAVFTPNVTGNVFEHNEAATYGNDIYSPPAALTTTATSFSLLSGKSAPTIKVTLRDNYGNEYDQLPPQFFFVFASVEAISNVTKPGYLSGTTSLQITNGHVSFTGLEIFGYPGNYRLRLGPSVGNTFYTGPTYVTYVNFEINNCLESEGNHQDDDDLSCDAILCSGCPVEKGATCVSPGNCSCPATYEGLQCEFVRDSYDSITLRFPTLPQLPSGHNNEEISVEMRDFISSELAKAYAKFEGVVVKFRAFTMGTSSRRAETTTFDFKYSLLLNNVPIEGEDLELYNDEATTYFSEEHGIGGLSSNLVNSEAIIMTYSDPVVIAVVIITAIMLAVTVALGIISLVKKDTPVIRSSSPIFCLLILIGVVLAYVTPFSYIGPQSTLSCAAPVVLGPMAFSIVFGNLLAKTFRIYRIFANRTMRASSPTLFQLLGVSGAILGLEMLFVIIWLAIDPPVPVRMGPEGARYWTCASPLGSIMIPIIVAYDGVLLLFGVFLAFKTRNAYSAYKETQLIGFTIYSLSIVAIAILPVLYLIELPLETQFAIRSFSILFVASVTMFLLFGNKVIVILFLPEQNTTEYFNNKNGSSSLKGGFVLKPMGSRTQTMSTTGFDINDVKMSSQGWMMILESKPWSQWKNMYAVQTGEYFGFFENEDCSGHRGGLHPISQWVVERIQTEGRLQMKLTLGDHSCIAETPNPDDMEKWFNSLVKVAHVNL